MSHVPSPILEAVDGMFLILLFFSLIATGQYTVRMTARDFRGRRWNPLSWSPETKAAWAMVVIFFGLILRVGSHWSLRHAANHGLHWETFTSAGPMIVLISTVLTSWGSVCWIRTIIPLRCGVLTWTSAAVLALVFGVYMAT